MASECIGTGCPGCEAGRQHYRATGCLTPGCTDSHKGEEDERD